MSKNTIMAFRARLKKRGYTEIHIKKRKGEDYIYDIIAKEPLAGNYISTCYTEIDMANSFRF